MHVIIHLSLVSALSWSGSWGSEIFAKNIEHEAGIHPGWDASTHIHTLIDP